MGSVSTLSQMLHLLLSLYDFRSIQSQAQANFNKSRALSPPPPILHERRLFERSILSAHSTPPPPHLPPAQWEKLDTVIFKDLVQSGKFTVKVTGLKLRDSKSLSSNSCDLQVKAKASQDEIWDAIENAGALEIYSTFDPDVRPSYPRLPIPESSV